MSLPKWFSRQAALNPYRGLYEFYDRTDSETIRGRTLLECYSKCLHKHTVSIQAETYRNNRKPYVAKKRVLFVGWAEWCRLTRNVPPQKWASVKAYGFRDEAGNLYKLKRRFI